MVWNGIYLRWQKVYNNWRSRDLSSEEFLCGTMEELKHLHAGMWMQCDTDLRHVRFYLKLTLVLLLMCVKVLICHTKNDVYVRERFGIL